MADKKSCLNYKLAIAKLAFWDGDIRCESCACMETYARKQCRLTGEYLLDTRATVGYECPLKFKEEDNGENVSVSDR